MTRSMVKAFGSSWSDAQVFAAMAALGVWSTLLCAATYAMQQPYVLNTVVGLVMMISFIAMFIIYWHTTRGRLFLGAIDRGVHLLMGFIASMSFAALIAFGMYLGPLLVKYFSVQQYEKELLVFSHEADQFPLMQQYAQKNFGVFLTLASAKDAWADTHLDIPGRSAASMHAGLGYCELHISPASIAIEIQRHSPVLSGPWVMGVQMHELAHCLDSRRDFADARLVGSNSPLFARSVFPEYRVEIHGMSDLVTAWSRPASQRWREIFSDVAAVGFWRLHYPGQANQLIGALLEKRRAAQLASPPDLVHNTACWVAIAAQSQTPDEDAALPAWADSIRDSSKCRT